MKYTEYQFDEVVTLFDKQRVPLSSMERSKRQGQYRYYGAQGIIDYIDDYIFDGKYLLLAEDGENLKSNKQDLAQLVDGKFWVNNHAHILQTKDVCRLRYFFYWINNKNMSEYITGSAQPKLSQGSLKKMIIPLPTLEVQDKILSIIKPIDEKIKNNEKVNDNLSQQSDLIFYNMFGQYYKESIIPPNWTLTELGNIDVLITDYVANGSFKSLADNVQYLDTETNNVLIRLTDFNNNFDGDMVYISDDSYEFLSKSMLYGDEIIISNVGANVGTVFRCPRLSKRMSLGPNAVLLRSKKYEHYLYLLFKSSYGQGLLQSIVTGSAQPKFNKTNFRALKILVPDDKTLSIFNETYAPMFEKITVNNIENNRLSKTRDTLLPKLMSGELDISNIDI